MKNELDGIEHNPICNDYCPGCIKTAIIMDNKEHKTDGTPCWCNPKVIKVKSNEQIIANEILESGTICKKYKPMERQKEYYTEGTIIVLIGIALIIIKLI